MSASLRRQQRAAHRGRCDAARLCVPGLRLRVLDPGAFHPGVPGNRDQFFLAGIARLAPDTTCPQATAQLNTVTDAICREYPQFTENVVAAAVPVKTVLLDGVETRFLVLMGAVAFVLLIACANLGNLLLARASRASARWRCGRRWRRPRPAGSPDAGGEPAARGPGRPRGPCVGVALLRVLLTLLPDDLPRLSGVQFDTTVLLYTLGVSLLAGLLFGAFPALQLANRAPMPALRDGARGSSRANWSGRASSARKWRWR